MQDPDRQSRPLRLTPPDKFVKAFLLGYLTDRLKEVDEQEPDVIVIGATRNQTSGDIVAFVKCSAFPWETYQVILNQDTLNGTVTTYVDKDSLEAHGVTNG